MYITRLTISKQPEFESEKPSNMFEREILIADDAVDSLMFGVLSTQEFCEQYIHPSICGLSIEERARRELN